jgi:methionyl-tRNA formyltransferase
MGTPQLAVPVLKKIIESRHEIALVVTQPDKPSGRHRHMTPPPVKVVAEEAGIPVAQPLTLKDEEFKKTIEDLKPDIGVVFAYGKIIPQWLLDVPAHGVINIHPSLLPRWRGAAPVQRPIMAGDTVTGVTIMQMVMALDAGDILLQQEVAIEPDDTTASLAPRLADIAADLIIKALDGIEAGTIAAAGQDESKVTYAQKITDDEAGIDWSQPAETIINQVRGLNPKPGAHTFAQERILKVWRASAAPDIENGEPGTIVHIDRNKGPYVATQTVPVLLDEVQPANKKRMSGAEFIRGYHLKIGDKLGSSEK